MLYLIAETSFNSGDMKTGLNCMLEILKDAEISDWHIYASLAL